jgi:hypothetical protein
VHPIISVSDLTKTYASGFHALKRRGRMGKAGEKQKRIPKTKDKRQYERFIETARNLGCDESEEAFERAFSKIVPPKQSTVSKPRA